MSELPHKLAKGEHKVIATAGRDNTLEEFKELMRTGRDFAGGAPPILQVMPWPVYGKMSDRELEAIYEFLRAIPIINPRPAFCAPPA